MQQKDSMKPQDIVILLKILAKNGEQWYHHTLAKELHISQSEVTESLKRSRYSGLIDASKKKVAKLSLLDFIEHGIKYVFPQKPGAISRGIPTVHSAPPLKELIISNEIFVWPDSKGNMRGQSVLPLYKSVTKAVKEDTSLYELLVLVDAIRIGRVREKNLAMKLLKEKILNAKQ